MTRDLPIRKRLTLWYSVMFATAALLLSSMSWWMLRHTIEATTRQDLQERVDDVRAQLTQFGSGPGEAGWQSRLDAIYHFRDEGKWLQVADENGQWVYRSPRMIALHETAGDVAYATGKNRFTELDQGPHHVRFLLSRVDVNGHRYTVETGISMNKQVSLLRRFGLSLLLLTPAVFAAAVLAGHWMSRKALSPVEVIANEARRITERNLDRRLPVSSAGDELAHLSLTLNNMLGRIDAGFRSVRDFTANASHELRTPLALLRTEAEIALLRPRSPQEYRDTLENMQTVATEMSGLIERLLALARAEAGSDTLRFCDVDLPLLMESVFHEWLPVTGTLGIHLRVERTADPMVIAGDRLALLQLLRIWLDNACKFTAPGGEIVIFGEARDEVIHLGVRDSGAGIPKEEQAKIFERFYRVKKDHGQNGAGLGLSLAVWIAEQHNASIQIISAPGEGSTFSVLLRKTATGGSSGAGAGFNHGNSANSMEGLASHPIGS